jgi:hypothetical protein
MAKRKYSILFSVPALFLILLFYGCPYESEFPLSDVSEAKIDNDLIGEWKDVPEGEEKIETPVIFVFCPFNDHEFIVLSRKVKKAEDNISLGKAFVTTIGDEKFLNVQMIGENEKTWFFVRYTVSGDTLTLRIVEDKLFKEKIGSSSDLRTFLENNLKNKDLYSHKIESGIEKVDELVFKRVEK